MSSQSQKLAKTDQTDLTSATELQSEHGKTMISDAVVAKIAGIAAREIKGVFDLIPSGVRPSLVNFAQRVSGADRRGKGVGVEVGQKEAAIDLTMIVHYGVNIPDVTTAVRENIRDRIYSMTGLTVREVNIDVADLFFEDERAEPSRRVE